MKPPMDFAFHWHKSSFHSLEKAGKGNANVNMKKKKTGLHEYFFELSFELKCLHSPSHIHSSPTVCSEM